jgi:hypothetical protein
MCLIAFAIDTDPALPLLLAANRDEFFERPTEPMHRWSLPDGTAVVAGRDLRDGGTWLGVSEAGRVAMLTNVRSAHPGPGDAAAASCPRAGCRRQDLGQRCSPASTPPTTAVSIWWWAT